MSIKVMTRVWDESKQKSGRLLLLLAIADHCDHDGVCWPGVKRLALKTRVSERQVQKNVKQLEASGELICLVQSGRTHTNRYFITIGLDQTTIKETLATHPELAGKGEPRFAFVKRVNSSTKKGELLGKEKVNSSSPEPSLEPSSNHHEEAPPKADAKHPAVAMFREKAHRYPPTAVYQEIADTVGIEPDDIEFWGQVVYGWIKVGWRPNHYEGMLERFRNRSIPTTAKGEGNGRNSQGSKGSGEKARTTSGRHGRSSDAADTADSGEIFPGLTPDALRDAEQRLKRN